MNIHEKMADDSEDEMSANNSESEMKYQEASTRTGIRPKATAGCKHQALNFQTCSIRKQVFRNCDNHQTTIKVHRYFKRCRSLASAEAQGNVVRAICISKGKAHF
jgi:hypothetical protein